jgi:hypothetical protein
MAMMMMIAHDDNKTKGHVQLIAGRIPSVPPPAAVAAAAIHTML